MHPCRFVCVLLFVVGVDVASMRLVQSRHIQKMYRTTPHEQFNVLSAPEAIIRSVIVSLPERGGRRCCWWLLPSRTVPYNAAGCVLNVLCYRICDVHGRVHNLIHIETHVEEGVTQRHSQKRNVHRSAAVTRCRARRDKHADIVWVAHAFMKSV